MADQLQGLVRQMQAEGVPEADILSFINQYDAPKAPATPLDKLSEGYVNKMRERGIEPTQTQIDMTRRATEGLLGGGVMTAAPGAANAGLKMATGLARRLYNGLLKPSKSVRQEFGDVVPGLLDKRRLITKGGAEAAEEAIGQSSKVANDMIANTPKPSQGVSARRVVQEFRPVRDAVRARVDAGVAPASDLGQIAERARRIGKTAKASGGRIDPTRAQTLKKTSQEAAEGAYAQMQGRSKKMLGTDDLLDAATARGFKGGLEDIIPGIGAQNKNTQSLIGEAKAMADAVGRTSNHLPFGSVSDLAAMSVGAANPLLGVAGKAATMAGPGSAMAIALNEMGKRGLDDATQRALSIAANAMGQRSGFGDEMQRALMSVMGQGSHK